MRCKLWWIRSTKTKAMFFGTAYRVEQLKGFNSPGIDLGGGSVVPFVDEAMSLGIVLDSSLTWKPPINHVIKKVNRAIFSLWFIKSCKTQALRKRLIEALVDPHLDHCIVVYLDTSQELRERIQRLINEDLRYQISCKIFFSHNYSSENQIFIHFAGAILEVPY